MNHWVAGLLGVAVGAGAVIGIEAGVLDFAMKNVKKVTATDNGYQLSMFTIPGIAGYNQPIGIALMKNNQPVVGAVIEVTYTSNGQKQNVQIRTDNNGLAVLDILTFHAQQMTVAASYSRANQVAVQSAITINFAAQQSLQAQRS